MNILALSVCFADTSPKGRGKNLPAGPWLPLWGSWQSRKALTERASYPNKNTVTRNFSHDGIFYL